MLSKMTKLTSDRICSHSWIQGFEKTNINWAGSFSAFSRVPASCNASFKEYAKCVMCSLGSKASSLLSSPLSLQQAYTRPSQQDMDISLPLHRKGLLVEWEVLGTGVSVPGKWEVEWQSWPRLCFSSLTHVSEMARTACWSFWKGRIWELVGERLQSLSHYSPPPTCIFNSPTLNPHLSKQIFKTQEASSVFLAASVFLKFRIMEKGSKF